MPLSEVLSLTIRQFWFFGERIEVYRAEDMFDALTVSAYPHMKKEDARRTSARVRDIIETDQSKSGVTREMDRKGLQSLKDLMRSNHYKRKKR